MLAQWPDDVARAVESAVYLHGLAADFAAQELDEKCVLATDVLAHLTDAFRYRTRDEDGLEWLCGLRTRTGREARFAFAGMGTSAKKDRLLMRSDFMLPMADACLLPSIHR